MLRDDLKNKAYFDDQVNFWKKAIQKREQKLLHPEAFPSSVFMKTSFRLVEDTLTLMHQRYGRGDDLAELKAQLEAALHYRYQQKEFADALPPNEQKDRIGWEELHQSDLKRSLAWFAFAYCLNMGQAYYQQVLDLIANQGRDALFDQIAVQLGDVDREVSDTLLFKRRFNRLYKVIQAAPHQRPKLMLAYLDAWYKLEGSPQLHLMDTNTYKGYWCWEAALVTKLYQIDDHLYQDHPYYPKDLVHWSERECEVL